MGESMVDIGTITGTISGVVGLLKEALPLAKKAGNRELNEKLADLQGRILDIQTQLIELANENRNLTERTRELEQAAEIGKKLVYEGSVYWLPKGEGKEGPFCPNCWDDQRKLIHLTPGATKGTYLCGVCRRGGFRTAEYKESSSEVLSVPGVSDQMRGF
jgi:hypothetical protein